MFIFGVFGVGTKEKEIKDVQNIVCKKCGSMSTYKLSKLYNYFHIFFIPVFKWGDKYYLRSRCCNSVFELNKEVGNSIENGEYKGINDEDMIELYSERNNYGGAVNDVKCASCSRIVDSSYVYCPHCGEKL